MFKIGECIFYGLDIAKCSLLMWIKKIEIEEVFMFEMKGSGSKFFIVINFME